jgi:hypothetical protein
VLEGRSRYIRNMFGSVISILTGLVTEEQLPADEVTEKELQRKARTVLAHALEVEKTMLQLIIEPLTVDPVRPKAYAFTPNSPPKYITVLSPPGEAPSLWLWSKRGRGGQGFMEIKTIAASFLLPHHIYGEHVQVIRHRKSRNFFYNMAS